MESITLAGNKVMLRREKNAFYWKFRARCWYLSYPWWSQHKLLLLKHLKNLKREGNNLDICELNSIQDHTGQCQCTQVFISWEWKRKKKHPQPASWTCGREEGDSSYECRASAWQKLNWSSLMCSGLSAHVPPFWLLQFISGLGQSVIWFLRIIKYMIFLHRRLVSGCITLVCTSIFLMWVEEKAAVRMLIDSPPELTEQVAHELESMWMWFHHSADHNRWKEVPSTMRNVSLILSSADVVNGEGVAGTRQGASHVVPRLEMLCRAGAVQQHVLHTRACGSRAVRLHQKMKPGKHSDTTSKSKEQRWGSTSKEWAKLTRLQHATCEYKKGGKGRMTQHTEQNTVKYSLKIR